MKKVPFFMACISCLTCCFLSTTTSMGKTTENINSRFTTDKSSPLYEDQNEKPLDRVLTDGGHTAIFRSIACIGDSLSSGEFEAKDSYGQTTYHDMYEYSWGQYIGRMCSSKVYNMSKGGMTSQYFCDVFANEQGYFTKDYAAQAYIISLGVNDFAHTDVVGSTSDVDLNDWHNNKKNFAGYYGQIIQRIKEVQPKAKIFLVSLSNGGVSDQKLALKEEQRQLLYNFTKMFDSTYVIDLMKYGPEYDTEFREKYFMGSHMTPSGYQVMGQLISSYIDYIIRYNMKDFKEVGFIGTNLHG